MTNFDDNRRNNTMEQKEKRDYMIIDKATGELVGEGTLKENEYFKKVTPPTKEQSEYCKNKRDMEAFTRSRGGFTWVFYINNVLLFNSDTISKANVSRLMMLATYMNYDNSLILDESSSDKVIRFKGAVEYMSKKDMQRVLNLKDYTFKQFFREVTEAQILLEEGGKFYLSKTHFYKGEIDSKRDEIECRYTRMFVNTVRQIYNGMETSQHSSLSYVFQLIPCIHHSTNFLCKDVTAHYTSIEYMNIEDICMFVGKSTDKDNMRKFKKDLMSIHVECNGRMAHLINEVTYSSSTSSKQRFVFNPYVVTSISQKEEINQIMQSLFVE